MASCVVCQSAIEEDARFCPSCGAEQPRVQAAEGDDPFIGKTIARNFKIEKLLGVGGMGKVYKARQLSLDKDVVIKVLHDHFRDDPQLVQRFQREARAASRLNHPNSIQVIDFGQDESGVLFMAIEFLNGTDLFTVLQKEGPFPAERIARIMIQVCSALHEAHEQNVIHRDLKPENIMVEDRRGRRDVVKVLDFGIAKIQDPDDRGGQALTQAGMVCGTPEYMSPEQARGQQLDARSDLYSLGVLVYQLATGDLPFMADSPIGIVTKHILEQPAPPRSKYPHLNVPAALERIILKAMDKDAGNRFQTAAQMQMAFEDMLRTSSGVVTGFEEPSQMAILRGAGAPLSGTETEDAQPAATIAGVGPVGAVNPTGTQVQMAKTGDTPAQPAAATGGMQVVTAGPRPTSPTPTGLVGAADDDLDFRPKKGGAKLAAIAAVAVLLVVGGVAFAMKDTLFGAGGGEVASNDGKGVENGNGTGTGPTGDGQPDVTGSPAGQGAGAKDGDSPGDASDGKGKPDKANKPDKSDKPDKKGKPEKRADDKGKKPDRVATRDDKGHDDRGDDGRADGAKGDDDKGRVVSRKPRDDDGDKPSGDRSSGDRPTSDSDDGKPIAAKDPDQRDANDTGGRVPTRDKPKAGDRGRAKELVKEANEAFLAGNSDKAYDLAKKAISADPSYPESRMIIANIHLKNGAKDKACAAGRDYVGLKEVPAARRALMLKRFCGE